MLGSFSEAKTEEYDQSNLCVSNLYILRRNVFSGSKCMRFVEYSYQRLF